MIKILFTIILLSTFSYTSTKSIDKKIQSNKKILNSNVSKKRATTQKINDLSKKINEQNSNITNLEKDIKRINADIEKHTELLEDSKKKISLLKTKSSKLIKKKTTNEEQIVDTIIEDFSTSIALKLASKDSLKELVDSEIYTILSQNSKDEILKLNNNYDLLTSNTKENQKKIKKISSYIKERQETKKTLNSLKSKHSQSLSSLEKQHKEYQEQLKEVVRKQESLKTLLSRLNILKKEEIQKERDRRERIRRLLAEKKKKESNKTNSKKVVSSQDRNQRYAQKLNLDVRKIGSSTSGVKITRYRGSKTIAPLKSFKVVKKFGTYYDPVYKIKLFNESVVLKTKRPKAKVVSVLNGKVVYAKKNAGMLENVVIVQHQNGLHTIYSHLDEIAPTLRVGKWIKKGYVVGRVNDNLMFQATKNSYHINPKDLFKI
ncbi:murein hydrolase activator EnvC family protein [Arcobacter roscoffensis]|uniref:Peptidoglycan DD-metalloendopeptidase family protein n=1 Tax=Arcobacter roscoffensis TaxID=2961520 RepID=A0ABY5E7L5_9BACT|nr:peptidoglycan DD-metalloendopeptidase family protein [Arcobacter roscoffensis]UTJ07731.1 peptidoglycan DD-metalloendopeptidase family protein [Arcobacter roscoffensis]